MSHVLLVMIVYVGVGSCHKRSGVHHATWHQNCFRKEVCTLLAQIFGHLVVSCMSVTLGGPPLFPVALLNWLTLSYQTLHHHYGETLAVILRI